VKLVVDVGLPLLIILAMTIVGLELTPLDLKRVLRYPAHVVVVLLGQVLALPLLAAVLILFLRPEATVAGGLILVAAAPQAIMSSYLCLLARGDVALSVTLTAVSSMLALATTPLIASLSFDLLLQQQAGFVLPIGKVMQQVVKGMLLPLGAGMLVRGYAPAFVARNRAHFQRLSLVALAALLTIVVMSEGSAILRNLGPIVFGAILFTVGAAAMGLAIAKAFSWSQVDTITMSAAFPARSLSIATLVSVNVLGRLEFLSFAVVFFLVQAALLVPAMIFARERTRS
jgi:BASS family bile acid:Na+ symporter